MGHINWTFEKPPSSSLWVTSILRKCSYLSQRQMDAHTPFRIRLYRELSKCLRWRGEGNLDRVRDRVGNEDMDESSQSVGARSNVTSSTLPPTPAAVPRRRAEQAGRRGIAAAISMRDIAMEEVSILSVQNRPCTPRLCRLRPLRYRPGSTRLGSPPAPVRQFNRHKLFLRKTRQMMVIWM